MQKSNTKKQHKNEKHRLKFLKKTLIFAYLFYIPIFTIPNNLQFYYTRST